MKQRYSSLDLRVIVSELASTLPGTRLTNIHDLTPRIFLLKFSRSTPPNPRKHLVLLDSGFRVHITKYARATSSAPSAFVAKLRKALKGKRVVGVRQVGGDRVVEVAFGDGGRWRLVMEFFAGGNVVLVDMEAEGAGQGEGEGGMAVAVLRMVTAGEEGGRKGEARVGRRYVFPVEEKGMRVFLDGEGQEAEEKGIVSREKVVKILEGAREKTIAAAAAAAAEKEGAEGKEDTPGAKQSNKKYKKKKDEQAVTGDANTPTTPSTPLKRFLSTTVPEFSPALVEHGLFLAGVDPAITVERVLDSVSSAGGGEEKDLVSGVVRAIEEAFKVIRSVTTAHKALKSSTPEDGEENGSSDGQLVKGYIVSKEYKPRVDGGGKKKKGKQGKDGEEGEGAGGGDREIEKLVEEVEVEDEPLPEELKRDEDGYVYDDFHPFYPKQLVGRPGIKVTEVEGFNNTVDTFFSSLESQKLTNRLQDRKLTAMKRLTTARNDHLSRVTALQSSQTLNQRKARAIENNLQRVEEAVGAVNSLRTSGMDWEVIGKMIDREKKRGNPVASIIESVKLDGNKITVLLADDEDDEDDEDDDDDDDDSDDDNGSDEEAVQDGKKKKQAEKQEKQQKLKIDIDLSLTGYANARVYYTEKKTLAVKEEKTIHASSKALKSTEKKVLLDLKKGLNKEKQLLRPVRQQYWWEKFFWFLSSEGYLVIGARDVQQAELIYHRHFKRGDLWVSADMDGAPVMVIKNHKDTPTAPIPPSTISQAGQFAVCASKAWDNKTVMSGWWTPWENVRKTVKETGEYLADAGRFSIEQKGKTYLPPSQLTLGWGVFWVLSDKSGGDVGAGGRGTEEESKEEGKEGLEQDGSGDEEEKGAGGENEEDDSDEEFPDAKVESGDEEEVEEEEENAEDAKADEGKQASSEEPDATTPEVDVQTQVQGNDLTPSTNPDVEQPNDGAKTTSPSANTPSGTKHLSAKERRDMKKKGTSGTSTPQQQQSAPSTSTPRSISATPSQSSTPATPSGKKITKNKRAANKKYALQSDEERDLARNLLGVAVSSPARSASPAGSATTTGTTAADANAAAEAERARKKEAYIRAQVAGKRSEAKRFGTSAGTVSTAAKQDEDGEEVEDDDDEDTEVIDLSYLTPYPSPGSAALILDAIPVCAPLQALMKCKYRVKFLPGPLKKSKAVRGVVSGWVRIGQASLGARRGVGGGLEGWDDSAEGGKVAGKSDAAGAGEGAKEEKEGHQQGKLMWKKEWEVFSRWRGDEGINGVPVGMVKVVGGVDGELGGGKDKSGGGGGKSGRGGPKEKRGEEKSKPVKEKGPKPKKKKN